MPHRGRVSPLETKYYVIDPSLPSLAHDCRGGDLVTFTSHNIRLEDGTCTKPEAGQSMDIHPCARMSGIFIYQILNHYTKPEDLDPGFLVLDNSSNERPDWYEYWPIRKFLLNEPLDEESFYGFFSPRFKHKTNLSAVAVHDFISRQSAATDVILLSPSIHLTAYHLNVFKYG